jgi:glycerol kinase
VIRASVSVTCEHPAAAVRRGCSRSLTGTVNNMQTQLQTDILGVTVVKPVVTETTALGAANIAGLAVGFWDGLDDLRRNWRADREWTPTWSTDRRDRIYAGWKKAVEKSLGW